MLLKKLAVFDMGYEFNYHNHKKEDIMHLILSKIKLRSNMIFLFFYEAKDSNPCRVEVCLMVDHSFYKDLEELFHQEIDEDNDGLIDLVVENIEKSLFFDILYQKFEMEINTCEISA